MTPHEKSLLSIIGAVLFAVPLFSYFLVLNLQYSKLKEGSFRLQILSTRAASCLPVYALIMFLSLVRPDAYTALEVPIAIFEGYSFYCFVALVVENLGGPLQTVKHMRGNGKDLCCTCCCPTDRENFYNRVLSGVFHFLTTRTVVTLVSVICDYSGTKLGKKLYIIFSLVAFCILVNGILGVVVFYENVMADCDNLMGISKFLILKMSVGLIVIQGIIVELIVAFDSSVDATNSVEIYCKCLFVICLFVIFFFISYFVFYLLHPQASSFLLSISSCQWRCILHLALTSCLPK